MTTPALTEPPLTRAQILALPAGRELDAYVAAAIGTHDASIVQAVRNDPEFFGQGPDRDGHDPSDWVLPKHSTDIAAAWQVLQAACGWLVSKRQRFFDELQLLAWRKTASGSVVAWPDVLVVLRDEMPEAICRAALLARPPEVSP